MRFIILTFIAIGVMACSDDVQKKGTFVPPANNTSPNNGTPNNGSTPNNATTPPNIGISCGNGAVDVSETCDPAIVAGEGACPTSCSSRACSTATLIGSPETCTAECIIEPVGCIDNDGCCTTGCSPDNDNDCSDQPAMCGNGELEAGELCDGNCPTSCPAGPSACQPIVLAGSANTCDSRCVPTTITSCQGGDGCCPNGCTNANDSDCMANCTPDTCANLGASCGNPPDGCGGTLNCGSCALGDCTDEYVCSNIGDPCTSSADCIAGDLTPNCLTNEPGGYCSANCETTSNPCPGDAWCSSSFLQDGLCNGGCRSNSDCRPDYECREATAGDPNTRTCLPIENM